MSKMLELPSLLYFILLLSLRLAFSSSLIAKPGCLDHCGNLSIPFPFGVGQKCSLDPSFDLICNNTINPPKAYLTIFQPRMLQVIEIKPSQLRVEHSYLLAGSCYSNSVGDIPTDEIWEGVSISNSQYVLSDENWLTAIGCDDLVLGIGEGNITFGGGCVSYCKNNYDSGGVGFCPDDSNGFSAGNGCCRASLPRGLNNLGAILTDLNGKWRNRKLFPCSYAFIQEKGDGNQSQISYPLSYLNDSRAFVNYDDLNEAWKTSLALVVRLDWRIGADNCSQAQRNSTTYACRDNTYCADSGANVGGYLCHCLEGYQGNPYLPGGCQDINECGDSTTNPCDSNSICTNSPGSVTCSCPEGYYGDGRKNGRGCNKLPQSKIINVWIGLGIGLGFLLLFSMCFWLHKVLRWRKNKIRKERFFKRNGGLLLLRKTDETTPDKTNHFPAKELDKATDHFNQSRILGQGAQGTVYKGMLYDGKIVAIKKSNLIDENQLEQFINEVAILSQINHRNVVRLLGCCLETEVPLLVYEFVPNGTLSDLIHAPNTEFPVSWSMRLKIAADVAGALAYLHSASSVPIYHRDVKSSNILLDEKYIVKVSDFGTSKTFAVDQTHLTTKVIGTAGYLDPEYHQSGQFTEKSDVYSFGVVLVELLTGQRPISLASRFLASMDANTLEAILDPQVSEQGRKEEVITVARLARRCLNLNGKMRPTMKEVVTGLESLRISQKPSTINDESKEAARAYEAKPKPIMITDIAYTWTNSVATSSSSSSSDAHPLMFATV